ncbi:5085_t:CDS:10 [Ambispora leptoticha]|uniref:5085_t:CDS:1 n=1 Tax=Ambispora leptoticha TaxID=144679 RepID=A0A9N8YQM6_9GLOM|nr:5085_t:CDS:10 [Ambispora leptoticha]
MSSIMCKNKRNYSTDASTNNENHTKKTVAIESSAVKEQILSKTLKSNVIEDYWHDIESYIHEPGFFHFDGPDSLSTMRDPKFIRKLISGAISQKRTEGDLLPSIFAKRCCELYEKLDKEGRILFMGVLAREFGVPQDESLKAAQNYIEATREDKTANAVLRAEQLLRHVLVPYHNIFFDRVNDLPDGTKFLLDFRTELLTTINVREYEDNTYLMALNNSLKEKLRGWLIGFSELERITWKSPAILLEKTSRTWRLFGYFYRTIPHEPLVFVQIALTSELSGNVQTILNDRSPVTPDHPQYAIFYSITSQPGLSGIELGSFLLKRVIIELQKEFPSIHTFSTLSPIPGFRNWLETTLELEGTNIFLSGEEDRIKTLANQVSTDSAIDDGVKILKDILKSNEWAHNETSNEILKPVLLRLCSRYILTEKRRNLARDPVANFHIRNGACIHRINWLSDTSDKGFEQSFGIMINYNYVTSRIEENNLKYLRDGTVTLSSNEDLFLNEEAARSSAKIERLIIRDTEDHLIRIPFQKYEPVTRKLLKRRLRKAKSTFSSGTFYSPIQVGNPPQKFHVQFDTGSAELWLPSIECKSAVCQSRGLFDPFKSSTCIMERHSLWDIEYADGDKAEGYYVQDTIWIGGAKADNQTFGLALTESDGWKDQEKIDGVFGLGFSFNNADIHIPVTPIETLFNQYQISKRVFAVYFQQPNSKHGEYTFGGIDRTQYNGKINWVHLSKHIDTDWIIPIDELILYPSSIAAYFPVDSFDYQSEDDQNGVYIGSGHALIDTGTTSIILPSAIVHEFHTSIPQARYDGETNLWAFPCSFKESDGIAATVVLAKREFNVPWKKVVGEVSWKKEEMAGVIDEDYCESWVNAMDEDDNEWILGAAFLTTTYTVFDMDSKKIGFATPN